MFAALSYYTYTFILRISESQVPRRFHCHLYLKEKKKFLDANFFLQKKSPLTLIHILPPKSSHISNVSLLLAPIYIPYTRQLHRKKNRPSISRGASAHSCSFYRDDPPKENRAQREKKNRTIYSVTAVVTRRERK